MKILMFHAPSFWFKTYKKVIESVPDSDIDRTVENALVVFYHAEKEDTERKNSVLTKFLKNIKWLSGKCGTKEIVLHSFNHLSTSKAPAEFTRELIDEADARLAGSGFTVTETPFGYLNEWKIHVAGESLAKVFKDI
jgi:predicted deacetylase